MKAHWVSYVLGFLCGPAWVTLSTLPVSQEPLSISLVRVNSSAKITCSTSLSGPTSLSLYQRFPENRIVYLNIKNGKVNKETYAIGFKDRGQIALHQRIGEGHSITFQLSLLGLQDTNLYFCIWSILNDMEEKTLSPGTIVIIRDPQEQCGDDMFDHILLALSATALFIVVMLCVGVLIVRCKRFKRRFLPAGAEAPPRPNRAPYVCPHHQVQHRPYLVTSSNSMDFRGIL